jgi:hypothetical protein
MVILCISKLFTPFFMQQWYLPGVGLLNVGNSISRSLARNSAVAVEELVPLELKENVHFMV